MTARAAAMAVVASLVAASCGTPLMKLPAGPGMPAPDAGDALVQATRACRAVRTLTAEVALSGSIGGRRVRTRLLAGVASPASARLEAVSPFGPPLFIFVAVAADATLLLPRDDRVMEHGRPEAVLGAIASLPLGAADLRALLAGCAVGSPGDAPGRALGDLWRVVPGTETEFYAHREAATGPWRLVAFVRRASADTRAWRGEFADFEDGLPRSIRLTSLGPANADPGFDLQLALSQVETNVAVGDEAFRVNIPPSSVPISLDELRRSSPLGVSRQTDSRSRE